MPISVGGEAEELGGQCLGGLPLRRMRLAAVHAELLVREILEPARPTASGGMPSAAVFKYTLPSRDRKSRGDAKRRLTSVRSARNPGSSYWDSVFVMILTRRASEGDGSPRDRTCIAPRWRVLKLRNFGLDFGFLRQRRYAL